MSEYQAQPGRDTPPDTPLSIEQSADDQEDLSRGLAGLAGLVTPGRPLDDALAQIAEFAARAIPGADGAGITVVQPGQDLMEVKAWAVTAPFVREIDHQQYDVLGEGPCLLAMRTTTPIITGSLDTDPRWPRFGPRIARLGVHSALSLPLQLRGDPGRVVGAINSYAYAPDAFTEHAVDLAMQFAGPAAASVYNTLLVTQARDEAARLQAALSARAVIDQAVGILRSRAGGSADEALGTVRRVADSEDITLTQAAERIIEQAVSRARARRAGAVQDG